ncbi:MAG: histone deacetylase [Desulfurivibrionaceae bacterium]|nr:histone deacetylase [Desulfobulbales bacterium]MDT8335223.1 histone deacetylase [Desulfurivibrionaceae bacterium]
MPLSKTFVYISHPRYLEHDTGGGEHPESPERLEEINRRLQTLADPGRIVTQKPAPAARSWIMRIHSEDYLLRFEETALAGLGYFGHPDNQLGYDTYEIALLAAGAGLSGIDLAEQEPAAAIFCGVRPPGHHAEKAMALGFCFLNNIAIAARYWQEKYGRRRLAIIDFDAHHGNGIQAAFEESPEVFYLSIHEHPTFSFPGTGYAEEHGVGSGLGTTMNIPLLPGAGDREVARAFTRRVEPALADFRPEALIIGAGFDGHRLDDMSGLAYSSALYRFLGQRIAALAERHCEGRLITILEGGYHLPSLGESFSEYCSGLRQSS